MDFNRLELLKTRFNFDPMSLLDIGSHIGSFAIKFKNIFPNCELTLIEPNINCNAFLSNISTEIYNVALSDSETYREFYLSKIDPISSGSSFYKENEIASDHFIDSNVSVVKLKTQILDKLFYGHNFDFIKMDVQGSEPEIINGGNQIFGNAKFVLIECGLSDYNPGSPHSPNMPYIIDKMRSLNFDIFDILEFHHSKPLWNNHIFQMDVLFKNQKINDF